MLSILAGNSPDTKIIGLNEFKKEDRPPVLPVFLSFRLMAGLAMFFMFLAILAFIKRNRIEDSQLLRNLLVLNIPLPYIAIFAGWAVAEIGRQPWIVYHLMRTSDAISPVPAESVGISLIAFTCVYGLLGIVDICLLRHYASSEVSE